MIGNSPRASSAGAILMPWIEPLKVSPARPLISVTLAERVRTKSSGWFSTSSHWMPMASMRTGRNSGHAKDEPVADPTAMKTPNPVLALNLPSPVTAKLRPSPVRLSGPTVTLAPTDGEGDHLLRRAGRPGVEPEVDGGERDERAQADLEGVDDELEGVDLAVGEGQGGPEGLVVLAAVGAAVVGGDPVGQARSEGAAREQLGPAGGDVDRAGEAGERVGAEGDGEAGDADPDVVELEDAAEGDLARRSRWSSRRWRGRPAGRWPAAAGRRRARRCRG